MIRSAIALTSLSLWVMKTIDLPDSFSDRMTASSSSVSCGVSTAVGSSRISRSTSRVSALTISTRCCTPTGRSSMIASGSTRQAVPLRDLDDLAAGPPPVEEADDAACDLLVRRA